MTDRNTGEHPRDVRASAAAAEHPQAMDLDTLYREHAGFVWRVVRRFGVPEEAAEDVVHEVFMVAKRRLPSYEGRGAPSSWLFGIARGVVANHRRSRQRAQQRLRVLPPPEQEASPDEHVQRQQAARLVRTFLAGLPRQQREVFELCDIEGMSGPETAAALRVGLNSVYSRLRLARRRFCAFLEEQQ